jgi:chromosome segregation protein
MVLRKLSIFGFKSFADKTELHFGEGITAVVGPNGCGKSNVVDAIRWVFGEQKTTVLRSSNMQEVIFSGTEKRQPLNMAEVTLAVSNSRGILPVEYNEVSITRRIFRSGESEYLINRTPSRLRDITNLFLDTGIGANTYTTIENSMINRILSDKAEERRVLFEEAAGIGKYKQRIRESQRKLDRTRQDLLRINDRVQEKGRYVRMLGRQVQKAKRYKRYYDDLKALELGFENRRFVSLGENISEHKKTIEGIENEIETLKVKITTAESLIEKKELQKVEKESELQAASRCVSDETEQVNSLDREISVSRERLINLRQNVTRFEQEIESIDSQTREKSEILVNIEKSIIGRQAKLEEHAVRVGSAQQELEKFDAKVTDQRKKVDELAAKQLNLVHSIGEKQKELGNCQTNLSNCIERCERDESEIIKSKERLEEYNLCLDNCRQQLEEVNKTFKKRRKTREKLLKRIQREDEQYHTLLEREKYLEAQIDSGKSKLHFLEGLDAAYEGYSIGVKALLEKKLNGTMGIVADLIQVSDPQMISLVERALGSAIQTVVFKTDADLQAAIEYLRTEKAGIARMVSLETLQSITLPSPVFVADESLPLCIHIDTKEDCDKLKECLFNRVLTCEDTEVAMKLQLRIEADSIIISNDGTVCYSNGTVVAGIKKKEQVGILQRKQEIERLSADIDKFQKEYNTVVHDKEICIITRDEAKMAMVEIDEKLNNCRQLQQEQETNIKHYETETEIIKERIKVLTPELSENSASVLEYRWLLKEYSVDLEEMEDVKKDCEAQIDKAKSLLEEMEEKRREHTEHLKNVELAKQGLTSRVEQDRQSIEGLKKDIENLKTSWQKKNEDKDGALEDIKKLEENSVTLQEDLQKKTAKREELQGGVERIREDYNAITNTIEEERKEVKVFHKNLEELSNRKHGFEVDQTRDEEQKRAIREKIYTTYEIDLQSPEEEIPVIDKEDAEIEENIHVLKERIHRVGEVNMGAIKEYEQESSDLKEMVIQRDDLQNAVDDLEKAIKKLNREARNQFTATFEKVQKNFRKMFITLFEGGEVSLELEENIDPLYAGIKINARPAGKKMRGITLLSGGERALTAISLLFALYLVKPSAYCILDELDAPLDDANIDRFVRVLKKFSEKTQFVIITHNKHTMEAADLLYGVTQQESGVSTVASVRLEDSSQLQAA